MSRILLISILFFNVISVSCGEIKNNNKIFRFWEETKKINKLKYCGIETQLNSKGMKRKISLHIKSEDILPGDGIKYFKIERDGISKVIKITVNKADPILILNNLKINSFNYATLIIKAKILSHQRKQIFGRLFWNSNLDSKYSIQNSTPINIKRINDYQEIKIDLKDNFNYLGQINNLVIHPLLDIVHMKKQKSNIDIKNYGIEEINENQTLCSRELEQEITINIKSIEFILSERKLLNREVNFEGRDFNALALPPLSQITYNLVVPENNPMLLFSVFTPYWSYGVDIDISIENDNKKKKHFNYKQRGFQYMDFSKLIEVDMTQYAGKQINLTFSISSFSNKDIIFLKNPLIIEKRKTNIPNVILVVSDALRADHLSCYGYSRSTSPNLDSLAKSGVIFTNSISQAPSSRASHASLFTGKFPLEVGLSELNNKGKLEEKALTLAEIFKDEGYLTYGLYTNPHINKERGFAQGLDDYFYYCYGKEKRGWGGVKNSPRIATEEAINLISKIKNFPFFLFLYYVDPHVPYDPPDEANIFLNPADYKEPFYYPRPTAIKFFSGREYGKLTKQDFNIMQDLYDGEIFNLDNHFGNFIDALKKFNLFEDTIIVFTSDHGEALGERGGEIGHGRKHYYEQCHVPLLISYPRKIIKGKSYDKITAHIDIAPTILTLIGKKYENQDFRGVPLFTEGGALNNYDGRHVHVETSDVKGIHSVYNDEHLLIYNIQSKKGMLFNYKEDKENIRNLKKKKVEIFNNLVKKILKK